MAWRELIGQARWTLDSASQIAVKKTVRQAHGLPFILNGRFGLRAEGEREQRRCKQINHAANLKAYPDR
ncbi:hypothetical protein [Maricaulis sp. MIT060901]|uniref:hypothetical protein n=1 Tax=Maricaulis sp. MIT060901 TaxID=3096993 RepID=UPI00399A71C7